MQLVSVDDTVDLLVITHTKESTIVNSLGKLISIYPEMGISI